MDMKWWERMLIVFALAGLLGIALAILLLFMPVAH
jgi:hypothetical protein